MNPCPPRMWNCRAEHRDVKPGNMVRGRDGVTKLVDFGLARPQAVDTQLTQQGTLLGTPPYMAPELWAGQEADVRSDLYALLVSYYYLLAGRVPFDAPTLAALGYQHSHEPLPDPRDRAPDLPDEVCRILLRGLAKDARDRYVGATALLSELDLLLAATSTPPLAQTALARKADTSAARRAGRKSPRTMGTPSWRRRALPLTLSGAAAAVLLLAVILYVTTNYGTVKIELLDPASNVEVKVDGEAIHIAGLREPLRLKAGGHDLQVTSSEFETFTKELTIKRGKEELVRVSLVPKPKAKHDEARETVSDNAMPSPQPLGTDGMTLVLDQSFDDPLVGPDIYDNDNRRASFLDGRFQFLAKQPGAWGTDLRGAANGDFVCEVTARLARSAEGGGWGLGFGAHSNEEWFGAFLRNDGGAGLSFGRIAELIPWKLAASVRSLTESNRLRVEVAGRRIRLFVNDEHIGDYESERYRPGDLLLQTLVQQPPVDVRFERVRLWLDETKAPEPPAPRDVSELTLAIVEQFDVPRLPAFDDANQQMGYADDDYYLVAKAQALRWAEAVPRAQMTGDFVCELDAHLAQPAGGWGLAFAVQDANDFLGAEVLRGGRVSLRWAPDPYHLIPWRIIAAARPTTKSNTLRVEVTGRRARLFLNGEYVGGAQDEHCRTGALYFFARSDGGPVEARFERLRVWREKPDKSDEPPSDEAPDREQEPARNAPIPNAPAADLPAGTRPSNADGVVTAEPGDRTPFKVAGDEQFDDPLVGHERQSHGLRLLPIAAQFAHPGETLSVAVAAEGTAPSRDSLRFLLGPGAPQGAAIDPESGLFTWTVPNDQAPGSFEATVLVEGPDNQRDDRQFTVQVTNRPKEIAVGLGGGVEMKMVLIPTGEFLMGSQELASDKAAFLTRTFGLDWKSAAFQNEHPLHAVRITRPFYLGTYHVTRGQFKRFIEATGHTSDAEKDGKGWGFNSDTETFESGEYDWRATGYEQTDEHPVLNVSWNDAISFCEWLTRTQGEPYRLPTEAEWEYACRAGTTTRYYCGDDPETLAQVGNVADAAMRAKFAKSSNNWRFLRASDGFAFTAPVGRFPPNAFGLHDMHGNGCQWCSDWFSNEYYASSPRDDPAGPASGVYRAVRGGCCFCINGIYGSAYRFGSPPGPRADTGFRVARTGQ